MIWTMVLDNSFIPASFLLYLFIQSYLPAVTPAHNGFSGVVLCGAVFIVTVL